MRKHALRVAFSRHNPSLSNAVLELSPTQIRHTLRCHVMLIIARQVITYLRN